MTLNSGVIQEEGSMYIVAFGPYRLGCYDDMDLCKRVCDLLSIKETVDNRGDVDRLTLHFDISTYAVPGCTMADILTEVATVPVATMVADLQDKAAAPLPEQAANEAAAAAAPAPEPAAVAEAVRRSAPAAALPPVLEAPGVAEEVHRLKPQWRRSVCESTQTMTALAATVTPSDCQHCRLRAPTAWFEEFLGSAVPRLDIVPEEALTGAVREQQQQHPDGNGTVAPLSFCVKPAQYGAKTEIYLQGTGMRRLFGELGLQGGDMLVLRRAAPALQHEHGDANSPAADAGKPGSPTAAAARRAQLTVGVVRAACNPNAQAILAAAAATLARRLSRPGTPPAAGEGGGGAEDEGEWGEEGGWRAGSDRAARKRRNPYGDDFATDQTLLFLGGDGVAATGDYDDYYEAGADEMGDLGGSDEEEGGGGRRGKGPRRAGPSGPFATSAGPPRRRVSLPIARPLRSGQTVPASTLEALRPLSLEQLVVLLTNFYTAVKGAYKVPSFGRRDLDMKVVFWAVMERGGYETVTEGKKWKEVCRCTGVDLTGLTSASFCMRQNYERCLLDFENYLACGQFEADVAAGCAPSHSYLTNPAASRFTLPEPQQPLPGDDAAAGMPHSPGRGERRPAARASENDEGAAAAAAAAAAVDEAAAAERARRETEAANIRHVLEPLQKELDAATALQRAAAAADKAVSDNTARISELEGQLQLARGRHPGLLEDQRKAQAAAVGAADPDPGLVSRVEELKEALAKAQGGAGEEGEGEGGRGDGRRTVRPPRSAEDYTSSFGAPKRMRGTGFGI